MAAFNLTALDTYKYPKEVEWQIDRNSKKEHIRLAKIVNKDNNISGVIIQHEYGIFGGAEGNKIVYFMQNCRKPMLVTLHTVLPSPLPKMKEVTEQIVRLARIIVVLTNHSKKIIETMYPDSIGKIVVIPHGIHPTTFSTQKEYKDKLELGHHTVLSTFGLLSPGKGIEYVIQALPEVIKKYPAVLYLILGETHPIIRRREGEKYRIRLLQLVNKLNLENHVQFYDQYLNLTDLIGFLKATDMYIATSINPNQAVSGTLSYALGTGRAVISTDFVQAREIVTPEIGRLVPIKNAKAIAIAMLDLLSDEKRLKKMSRAAYKQTRTMLWSNVAKEYVTLLTQTMLPSENMNHLYHMTDSFGLFQFAQFTLPNKSFGYTLDDNARALILCSWLLKQQYSKQLEVLVVIYLNFIQTCLQTDGTFINYISFEDKSSTKQNENENLEDAQSRALWALSEIISNESLPKTLRDQAKTLFLFALHKGSQLTHLRAKAFAIKAFALAQKALPEYRNELLEYIKKYSDSLLSALIQNTHKSWLWFENHLKYSNGLLPESLLIAGDITKNDEYTKKGLLALRFLIDKTFSAHMYQPIGNSHWYEKDKKRSYHDQQPEDPASMIFALTRAYEYTHLAEYKNLANNCFSWFIGNNSLHLSMYDEKSGGCYDGLRANQVNLNEGAESLVSYLMSRFVIQHI